MTSCGNPKRRFSSSAKASTISSVVEAQRNFRDSSTREFQRRVLDFTMKSYLITARFLGGCSDRIVCRLCEDGSMRRVLVIEDDDNVLDVVKTWLEREGYEVLGATDGNQGLEFMDKKPDLVILDVMLPGLDGLTVCQEIRKRSPVPILMLSARSDTIDRVVGLETGADDYLGKPFHPKELVARVRAMFRRQDLDHTAEPAPATGDLQVDATAHKAYLAGEELELTLTEFELLACLSGSPNRVYSRQDLLDRIWGDNYFGSPRVVDSHIRNLRAKLREARPEFDPIASVRGVGYRFEG